MADRERYPNPDYLVFSPPSKTDTFESLLHISRRNALHPSPQSVTAEQVSKRFHDLWQQIGNPDQPKVLITPTFSFATEGRKLLEDIPQAAFTRQEWFKAPSVGIWSFTSPVKEIDFGLYQETPLESDRKTPTGDTSSHIYIDLTQHWQCKDSVFAVNFQFHPSRVSFHLQSDYILKDGGTDSREEGELEDQTQKLAQLMDLADFLDRTYQNPPSPYNLLLRALYHTRMEYWYKFSNLFQALDIWRQRK